MPAATGTDSTRRVAQKGLSLVELLVATVIAGITLCAAWGWLWGAEMATSKTVDRARAATAAAFAARSITDDLDLAATLLDPQRAHLPQESLSLRHVHPDDAPEDILIVWDPVRRVLWRKASGTYLADHVTRFAVSYLDGDGHLLSPADLRTPDWPARVSRVKVEIAVSAGRSSGLAACDVTLGQP